MGRQPPLLLPPIAGGRMPAYGPAPVDISRPCTHHIPSTESIPPFFGISRRTASALEELHNPNMGKETSAQLLREHLADHVRAAMATDDDIRTQPRLALRAGVGVGTVNRILCGQTGVTLETLEAVARACGVQAYKLLQPLHTTHNQSADARTQAGGSALPRGTIRQDQRESAKSRGADQYSHSPHPSKSQSHSKKV